MGLLAAATQSLRDALTDFPGAHLQPDFGPNVDPPALVIGPPALQWESGCPVPTEARFLVYIVVTNDDRFMDRLDELIEPVAAAIDATRDAVVIRADPGRWPTQTATGDLPAYELTVEVAL